MNTKAYFQLSTALIHIHVSAVTSVLFLHCTSSSAPSGGEECRQKLEIRSLVTIYLDKMLEQQQQQQQKVLRICTLFVHSTLQFCISEFTHTFFKIPIKVQKYTYLE